MFQSELKSESNRTFSEIRDNWPADNWPVDNWPVTFLRGRTIGR